MGYIVCFMYIFQITEDTIMGRNPKKILELRNFMESIDVSNLVGKFIEFIFQNDYWKHQKEFIQLLEEYSSISYLKKGGNNRGEQTMVLISEVKANLKSTLVSKYLKINQSFIDLEWHNLSYGEKAFLNLFSEIYHQKLLVQKHNEVFKEHDERDFIYILLDEPDLGLHPQWQKQLLSNLVKVLPQIFLTKKIQLILTSHSPFLVSDLPKENIIFLEKDTDGKCKVSDLEKHKATFGANIHTLFTDSFFMSGGLIGDFAKEKLKIVLENLTKNETKITENQRLTQAEIKFIISQIGEPLLRKKFERLYNEKFTSDKIKSDEDILQEEADLKQKLAEIEKIKTQRNLK